MEDSRISPSEHESPPSPAALPLWPYLGLWLCVVAMGLKIKHRLLTAEGGGFDFLAELQGIGHGEYLPLSQKVALFREDVLLPGILGSIVFLGVLRIVRPSWRPAVAGTTCFVLFLLLYIELKAYWEVGTFISIWMIGVGAAGAGRELVGSYAESATIQRLVVSLAGLVGVAVSLYVAQRSTTVVSRVRRLRAVPWLLTAAAGLTMIAFFALRVPATPYHRSAFESATTALFRGSAVVRGSAAAAVRDALPDSLIRMYARATQAPVPNARSKYFGRARGHDVIVLIYESLPWTCSIAQGSDSALRNLRRLERRGFRADGHYATYPYSRRAYASIYGSWYPANNIRGTFPALGRVSRQLEAPGMVQSAAAAGYETAVFVPEEPVTMEEDRLRYAALGFRRHEVPTSAYQRPELGPDSMETRRAWLRVRDRESFDSLKASVTRAVRTNQRYLYAFHPQLTHGPWPDLTRETTAEETCRRGLLLYAEVDRQLGELIDLLEQLGRLDRTIIVALGDHGLRTRTEYPAFRPGTLDDVTFHVPLVIAAPGVVDTTTVITWMTSHVDIAPSVLDLLGITVDRGLELGSPLWDERVARRTTFFFAREYLGADGYQQASTAVMLRYLYGGVSRAPWAGRLQFRSRDLLARDDSMAARVARDLELMSGIQQALTRTMLPGERYQAHRTGVRRGRSSASR